MEKKTELTEDIIDFVTSKDSVSCSDLQRRFRIGYHESSHIMELLKKSGIIGQRSGTKPIKVLTSMKKNLKQDILNKLFKEQTEAKVGTDGVYETIYAVTSDSYDKVTDEILSMLFDQLLKEVKKVSTSIITDYATSQSTNMEEIHDISRHFEEGLNFAVEIIKKLTEGKS